MTWNPVTGCSKISPGCAHCYAERMAKRLKAMGVERYSNGFEVTLHPDLIDIPKNWKSPRRVFVNSMSDLFHERVPVEFISRVFQTMNDCPQHSFQILTKRSGRLLELARNLKWTSNIWMGVTVESSSYVWRIHDLKKTPAQIRFLSVEPLLTAIPDLPLEGIHWVIVGGESGPGAREMQKGWVQEILRQCRDASVPFFFKQWGGVRKDLTGRELNGRTYAEFPQSIKL
jgi:protein gp37